MTKNKQIVAINKEEMDAKQTIGGRRSKRLILKRDNAKMQNERIVSEQNCSKTSTKRGKYVFDSVIYRQAYINIFIIS